MPSIILIKLMRALIRTGILCIRAPCLTPSLHLPLYSPLYSAPRFYFAKISKKEQSKSEKKKEKSQAKQALGGNTNEIDLDKYEQSYAAVLANYREQLSTIRFGRLQASAVGAAQVKIGGQTLALNGLAQVSAKGANSCVVSPFDSSQCELIEKALRAWDDSLEIKRTDNTLTLTQPAMGKEAREKLQQRVKKLGNDRREEFKRVRSSTQDELRKYKKIVPEDRLRVIQNEAKAMFQKKSQQIDKLQKEKEKELLK